MDRMLEKCTILFLYLSFINAADDVCIKTGSCTCVFSNGTGYDLTPSAGKTFFEAQQYTVNDNSTLFELHTYYYHPCYDIAPKFPINPNGNGSCVQDLSLCRLVNKMLPINKTAYDYKIGSYEYLGAERKTHFSKDGRSIIYDNAPSSTVVMLVCAETEDKLQVYSLEDPNKLVLAFYSRNACMKELEHHGRSFGSNLLIIFFTMTIFYLVLGICTKKFLMGATGMEVIPNITFWTDLPNLVKDGWAFALSGFKLPPRSSTAQTSPNPNTYDTI